MKKGLLIICAVSIGALISSCSSSVSGGESLLEALEELDQKVKYEKVDVAGLYSMEIPDYMTSTTLLNDQASLQYNHLSKEEYIIVINESKQEFVDLLELLDMYDEDMSVVENFAAQQSELLTEGLTVIQKSDMEKVNGKLPMCGLELDARMAGIPDPISYYYGFVEGEENLYTVMTWTLLSNKEKYHREALHMIKSLEEK
ncbi:MAG: hypothetical protein P8P87_08160 [Crocinitomicaceae bacterium]|nr:hypothetical protein [Crocinitomicaceae bacterium]